MSRAGSKLFIALTVCWAVFASPQTAHAEGAWAWPLRGPVAFEYGARYTNEQGRSCSHGGLDIAAGAGATVAVCVSGEVTFSGLVPAGEGHRAWAVTVLTADGLRVTYLPLERASVRSGESVIAGEALGELSGFGDASSPAAHLHLGVRRGERALDPLTFLGRAEASPQSPEPPVPVAPPAVRTPPPVKVAPPVARAGSTSVARVPVNAASRPVASARSAPASAPSPAPSTARLPSPVASMPGLDSLRRIAPVADPTRVRTAAVSADLGGLRDLLAAALVRLALVGAGGACAWPVLRGVLAARRDPMPAPVAVRRGV